MVLVAVWAAGLVERRSERVVTSALLSAGLTWPEVRADGLNLFLSGTAPDEAARFRALNLAGGAIDAGRLRDEIDVAPARAITAPRFSVELLRNTDGVSLIGLLPEEGGGRDALRSAAGEVGAGLPVSDMLETAAYAAPEGFDAALDFGIAALKLLPRSKISVSADRVTVTAISGSAEEKRRLEAELAKVSPAGLSTVIDISAPRPVLTPFTLRFVKDSSGARFDACSADTERARNRILAAAEAAGAPEAAICTVGLGVPTPRWTEAAEAGIAAIGALPEGGTISFSDADVTLTAAAGTRQADFDRVVGELQAALPQVFALTATLTPSEAPVAAGPAEFTAVLNGEGRVELRGRVSDDLLRSAADSVAKARFGADAVYNATRVDGDLPEGWPVRVLAGLEALSQLHDGRLLVRADTVEVHGISGRKDASARIAQVLSAKLGPGQTYTVDVRYDEAFDPDAALPTPDECVAELNRVLALRKIAFAPGSAEIDGDALGTIGALAGVLKDCPPMPMEIAGHTDAQGSEGGNQALSQARAEAVLLALQGRRLAIEGFIAVGYGESRPIADNETEEGREANRRIEFTLIGPPDAAAGAVEPTDGFRPAAPVPAPPQRPGSAAEEAGADAGAETGAEAAPAPAAGPEAEAGAAAADPAAAAPGSSPGVSTLATSGDAEAAASAVDGTDASVQVAGAGTAPDAGATRSVALEDEAAGRPDALYQPTEETTLRPLNRTRTQP
jgi:OOP family OmpA-OmpF porin